MGRRQPSGGLGAHRVCPLSVLLVDVQSCNLVRSEAGHWGLLKGAKSATAWGRLARATERPTGGRHLCWVRKCPGEAKLSWASYR